MRPKSADLYWWFRQSTGDAATDAETPPAPCQKEAVEVARINNSPTIPPSKLSRPWNIYLEENKVKWKELSIAGTSINLHIYSDRWSPQFCFIVVDPDAKKREEALQVSQESNQTQAD